MLKPLIAARHFECCKCTVVTSAQCRNNLGLLRTINLFNHDQKMANGQVCALKIEFTRMLDLDEHNVFACESLNWSVRYTG